MSIDAEVARLDAVIAANDTADTPHARWKAADALFKKADLVEERVGSDAALPLYEDVVRRLDGATDEGPRELLICALANLRLIHERADRTRDNRAVAERIIDQQFQDPPEEAIEAVVDVALHLSRLLLAAGEDDRARELLERVVERFGRPEVPNHILYRCAANTGIAGLLAFQGKVEEGIRLYERVITEIEGCTGQGAEAVLAEALAGQAVYLYRSSRFAEAEARCKRLLARFREHPDEEIAIAVREAQEILDRSRRRRTSPSRSRRR